MGHQMKKKPHSSEFKFKVAIEVMLGLKHPSYWSFKQTQLIEQQLTLTTQTLSSSLAA